MPVTAAAKREEMEAAHDPHKNEDRCDGGSGSLVEVEASERDVVVAGDEAVGDEGQDDEYRRLGDAANEGQRPDATDADVAVLRQERT